VDDLIARYCALVPGVRPDLKLWPTRLESGAFGEFDEKSLAKERLAEMGQHLAELQRRLWAEKKHKVLVVLQGLDTSGKDGTVRNVFRFTHPNGVNVAAFDKPTRTELSYDYLRRIHERVPHNGELVIFDRSHYEDIIAVRVNNLKPTEVWQRRYRHLNDFEQMLADEGVRILKIFLHISAAEQKERLEARLKDPEKHWKFDESDLVARSRWKGYQQAYEDVLERCNAPHAPWYIIPADKKWQRNLLVAQLMTRLLESLQMEFPDPHFDPGSVLIE
jgi:PPK2 family polyphosphate:nucleotide phosphotransferase